MAKDKNTELINQLETEKAKIIAILDRHIMPLPDLSELNRRQGEIEAQLKELKREKKVK